MIQKKALNANRLRQIKGSFAFIEHRFLQDGFWESLTQNELLLYLFLIIVADRSGLSYYSYDKICTRLQISLDEYILSRNNLIDKDLIAFDGVLTQVLSLPEKPVLLSHVPTAGKDHKKHELTHMRQLLAKSIKNIDPERKNT